MTRARIFPNTPRKNMIAGTMRFLLTPSAEDVVMLLCGSSDVDVVKPSLTLYTSGKGYTVTAPSGGFPRLTVLEKLLLLTVLKVLLLLMTPSSTEGHMVLAMTSTRFSLVQAGLFRLSSYYKKRSPSWASVLFISHSQMSDTREQSEMFRGI